MCAPAGVGVNRLDGSVGRRAVRLEPARQNQEGWRGRRYCAFHDLERWRALVLGAGFDEVRHYYRPDGLPREQQPWLASLWRRPRGDTEGRPR